jgi:hypothetical protein
MIDGAQPTPWYESVLKCGLSVSVKKLSLLQRRASAISIDVGIGETVKCSQSGGTKLSEHRLRNAAANHPPNPGAKLPKQLNGRSAKLDTGAIADRGTYFTYNHKA